MAYKAEGYIKRKDALDSQNKSMNLAELRVRLKILPTDDFAPVRHSKIIDRRKVEVDGEWECARCGWQYTVCVCGKDVTKKIHYCPICGATLDAGGANAAPTEV